MAVLERLARQRRFKIVAISLLLIIVLLSYLVVPIERDHPGARIHTWFDGVWWTVTTVTSVGYGDLFPVTVGGRIIGMILSVIGVVMFGMIIGMVTVSLYEERDAFYRKRFNERIDAVDEKLVRIEKQGGYVVRRDIQDKA